MPRVSKAPAPFPSVEIDGRRFFLVPEPDLEAFRAASDDGPTRGGKTEGGLSGFAVDDLTLAARLRRRREDIGLTQLDLAARAGVRHETLNRIERGKTTPDFRTIRKLVVAMDNAAAQKGKEDGG